MLDVECSMSSTATRLKSYGNSSMRGTEPGRETAWRVASGIKVTSTCPTLTRLDVSVMRRGKPVVLTIDSASMHNAEFPFYLSDNGVWLTDTVPVEFIQFPAALGATTPS